MDAYGLAIEQARRELEEAQQNLKSITLRVSQLESLVAQLEALTLANNAAKGPMLFKVEETKDSKAELSAAKPETAPPLWKAIINALNGKKADFTVPDALAALERTGRKIGSPNRANIVRNTVIQNKAFGRLGPGHYYVVGYEKAVANEKEAPEETS